MIAKTYWARSQEQTHNPLSSAEQKEISYSCGFLGSKELSSRPIPLNTSQLNVQHPLVWGV